MVIVLENGNVTTYEWIHKEKPLRVEEPPFSIDDDVDEKSDVVSVTCFCSVS